jgi:hypothetical protein
MIMVPAVGAALAGLTARKSHNDRAARRRHGSAAGQPEIPGMPLHDYEYCLPPTDRSKQSLSIDLKSTRSRGGGGGDPAPLIERADHIPDQSSAEGACEPSAGLGPSCQAMNPAL